VSATADRRIALLVSGASGMALPVRVLRVLASVEAVGEIHLVVSKGASLVLAHELARERTGASDLAAAAQLPAAGRDKLRLHRDNELDAPIASGSFRLDGTVVLPCSSGTLGALATGEARTLLHRAGAVALKERWPLVLGFRETPLTIVHLENLRRLAYAGAVLLPPIPAFYVEGAEPGERAFDRFLSHYALRILDHLGLAAEEEPGLRWGPEERR
jgi:4-hydroxy-3-polyprenylbenzoate decarboxylase